MKKALILLLLCLAPTLASAGGFIMEPDRLAMRSTAIVLAHVTLNESSGANITVHEWIWGKRQALVKNGSSDLMQCTLSKASLRLMMAEHPKHEARAYWQKALEQGSYDAILFLRPREGDSALVPTCGVEVQQAKHWTMHPEFQRYRQQVEAALPVAGTNPHAKSRFEDALGPPRSLEDVLPPAH